MTTLQLAILTCILVSIFWTVILIYNFIIDRKKKTIKNSENWNYRYLSDFATYINQYATNKYIRKEIKEIEGYFNVILTKLFDDKIIDMLALMSVKHIFKENNIIYIVTSKPGKLIGKRGTTIDLITNRFREIYNNQYITITLIEFGYQYTDPMYQNESWDIPE